MELDSPPTLHRKKQKIRHEISGQISEKKRKHRSSEIAEPASSKRQKHAYKHRSESAPTQPVHEATERSPFHLQTSSLYLPLSPIGRQQALQSLCAEHVSPLLLTYYPPFHGVIISYNNPRLSTTSDDPLKTDGRQKVYARSILEYGAPFIWLTADFLILNPQKGDICDGYISLQNESSLGLICWNFFSASIERKRLPYDWTWISNEKPRRKKQKLKKAATEDGMDEDERNQVPANASVSLDHEEGYWQDGKGKKVSGTVQFRVHDVDTSCGTSREFDFMSILGTMLSDEEEKQLRQKISAPNGSNDGQGAPESHVTAGRAVNGHDGAMDTDGTASS